MNKLILMFFGVYCAFLAFGTQSLAVSEATASARCVVTDTELDADLDAAGPNSLCGEDDKGPWACFCEITEECREGGKVFVFHRSQFLGCGQLSDCRFHTRYGRLCARLED